MVTLYDYINRRPLMKLETTSSPMVIHTTLRQSPRTLLVDRHRSPRGAVLGASRVLGRRQGLVFLCLLSTPREVLGVTLSWREKRGRGAKTKERGECDQFSETLTDLLG